MRQFAPLALVLLSATVAVCAYLQALGYPFVSDDENYITANSRLAGLHLTELWRLFIEPYSPHFEFLPLRELSYWLDITLFGLTPAAFRVHNIILYLLSLPLAYGTTLGLWRYFRPADSASAPWAAAAVTALFALHPALVESVVWISGRKYVLPNFFSMLALWLAVNVKRGKSFSSTYAAAALAAFVAVMLSKSSYVAIAPIIALLWIIFWLDLPAQERRRSLLLWPAAILVLAVTLLQIFISNNKGFDTVPFYFGIEAVTRTLAVLGGLVRLAITPESRHFFNPVFEDPWFPVMVALGVAVLAGVLWGLVGMLRQRSLAGLASIIFLLLCMPYLQLIPAKPPSLVSDRYVALAVWPAMLLVVILAWRLKPAPRAALLLAIALPFIFQTVVRTRDWRSEKTLIDADLRAYPGYYMPATYKAWDIQVPDWLHQDAIQTANSIANTEVRNFVTRLVQADYAVFVSAKKTGNPHEALTILMDLNAMLKQPPARSRWDTPISSIWRGGQDAVESEWQALAEQFPDNATVRYNAGLWLLDIHKYESAAGHLHAATGLQQLPESVRGTAFKNLGIALINTGRITEAEAPLRAAVEQVQPDKQAYCLLADVYRRTGQREAAVRAMESCSNLEIRAK